MCGNILPCFASLDDRGNRTNQHHWLELLHASYISLFNQARKGRVFYSVNKCFETGADQRNIFDKQILNNLDAVLRDSARDVSVEFECSRHREILASGVAPLSSSSVASSRRSVSQGAVQKTARKKIKKKRGERKRENACGKT